MKELLGGLLVGLCVSTALAEGIGSPMKERKVDLSARTAKVALRASGMRNAGAVVSFVSPDGREYAAKTPCELFSVRGYRLDDAKKGEVNVTSAEAKSCTVDRREGALTLTFANFPRMIEKAVCTVRADAADGMLHWRISIGPKAGCALARVTYPQIALDETLGATGVDDVIVHGGRLWGAVHDPGRTWDPKKWDGVRVMQPGDLFAQFGCYYDPAGGFYTQAQDATGLEAKQYWIWRTQTAIQTSWTWMEWIDSPREVPYDLVTGTFGGPKDEPTEWTDAADIYKKWALGCRWCRTPFRDRTDLPDWLRSAPPMVRFHRDWLAKPEQVDDWLTRYWRGNFAEMPLIAAVWGWEKVEPWVTPDYFPAYPSDETLAKIVGSMRRNGGKFFPWPSGYHWTLTHTKLPDGSFKYESTNAFRRVDYLAVRKADGSIMKRTPDWYNGGEYADLCRGDVRTREWWTRNVSDKLIDRGAEMIQFDQVNGGRHPECWSTDHGHAPVAGRWWSESMLQQLDHVKASAAVRGVNLVLGFEDPNEFYLDRVGVQDYRDIEITTSNRTVASVWSYLYHEFAPPFQSNPRLQLWPRAHYAADGQIPFFTPRESDLGNAEAIPNGRLLGGGLKPSGWRVSHSLRKGGTIDYLVGGGPDGANAVRLTAKKGERPYFSVDSQTAGDAVFKPGAKFRLSCLAKVSLRSGKAAFGDGVFTSEWKWIGGTQVALGEVGQTSAWQRYSNEYVMPKGAKIHHYAVSLAGEGTVDVADLQLESQREDGTWTPVVLRGDVEYLAFMKAWIDLYHGEGRDFLAYGRRIRPPRVSCATMPCCIGRARDKKPFVTIVETVCSAAYETLDGQRQALMLANGSEETQTARWTWQGRSYDATLKSGELRLIPLAAR